MDKSTQAKNGFKTFILTLSVSLVIFSAIYYFITDYSSNVDIESFDSSMGDSQGVMDESDKSEGMGSSVFATINASDVDAAPRQVLGGADTGETTESTVPDTGSETLLGTMLGVGFFAAAVYVAFVGPRKLAIQNFESNMLKGSDD
jgi:hypothetical protein